MQDRPVTDVVRQNVTPMPIGIGKLVIEAISKISGARATGNGEDESTARRFTYTSINDVLDAAHDALNEVGLAAMPMEVEYSDEVLVTPLNTQVLKASYVFKFRLLGKDGSSWVDEQDKRHVTLIMPADGKGSGKAQSLATRDYLKGLLRIRTIEPDEEVAAEKVNGVEKQPRETGRIPPKNTIFFDFGNGLEAITPQEVEVRFADRVAGLKFALRKQWETANATGLRELHELDKPLWLRIRADLDRDDRKRSSNG